jgi:pyruvate dehydrogenase E2 component (dihydrolipoamide acetyltransferase)
MSTNVIMPQMGESIFEGTITKWLKKAGEKVKRDEPLFEISTDKVDSEIPSPASGVVREILIPEGKTVQINTVVAVIESVDETAASAPAVKEIPAATVPAPAAEAALLTPAAAPSSLPEPVAPAPAASQAAPVEMKEKVQLLIQPRDIRTSPLVRRIARENDVDLAQVKGSGLEARITKEDVMNFIEQRKSAAAAPAVSAEPVPAAAALPAADPGQPKFFGEAEMVPMTAMRKSIADHMVASKRISAHVNTVFEVDMTSIAALREKHKEEFEKREGVKLTFTPFIIKALVDTVREFPIMNCSVSGDSIVYKKPVNVGVAVALETGLIVPVVKDAQLKSFTGIALAVNDLAQRARTKRLRPEEVQNGTISVTNPGIYGPLFGTPIISQPQVAILGVGGIEKRPIVINDAIAIRSMVYLSLTFDHRVIDGAVADQFMASLKARLQTWSQWID